MNPTIEIIVDAKGEVTLKTTGFAGSDCRAASALLEKALGQQTGEQLTAEFHQGQSEMQALKQGQ